MIEQTSLLRSAADPLEEGVSVLFHELELAQRWSRPSILVAIYAGDQPFHEAETALEQRLAEAGQKVIRIGSTGGGPAEWLEQIVRLPDLGHLVCFLAHLEHTSAQAGSSVFTLLDNQRAAFLERGIRMVLWLTEQEAIHLAHDAADFWSSRHRVVELMGLDRADHQPEEPLPALPPEPSGNAGHEPAEEALDDSGAPERASLLLSLGIMNWRRRSYALAGELLKSALELAERIHDPWLMADCHQAVALLQSSTGEYSAAVESYHRAIALAPERITPWNQLGHLYFKLGMFEEAIASYQKALQAQPHDSVSWNGLGQVCLRRSDLDAALDAFVAAIQANPGFGLSWENLATVYVSRLRLDDALVAFQQALLRNPQQHSAWLGLAKLLNSCGLSASALLSYQQALQSDVGQAGVWFEYGNLLFSAGSYEEATSAFRRGIAIDPGRAWPYSNLGLAYIKLGQYPKAAEALQRSIELPSSSGERAVSLCRLGNVYRRLEEYFNAMTAYQKADELDPNAGLRSELLLDEPAHRAVAEMAGQDSPQAALSVSDDLLTEWIAACVEGILVVPEAVDILRRLEFNRVTEMELPVKFFEPGLEPEGFAAESAPVEPVAVKPGATEPVVAEQAAVEPAESDPVAIEPAATEPAVVEQAAVGPAESDPAAIEPAAVDCAVVEAASATTAAAEPAAVDLAAEPPVDREDEAVLATEGSEPVLQGSGSEPAAVPVEQESSRANEPAPAAPAGRPIVLAGLQTHIVEPVRRGMQSAQIWNELGNIYMSNGDDQQAISAYLKAIELEPGYGWPYSNLGLVYASEGKHADAILLLRRGIELLSEARDRAIVWARLGNTYRQMRDYENAILAYQQADALDPDNPSLASRERLSEMSKSEAQRPSQLITLPG